MTLYVNTNTSSINAQRQLSKSTKTLDSSYKKLASGLRINSAKDDAAGLQIASRMTAQINGLTQGNRNANDGISFAQTAEGALDEVTNMLQRIRTLAVQAKNGTNSSDERIALQDEVTSLAEEIKRIGSDTKFGKNLNVFQDRLNGSSSSGPTTDPDDPAGGDSTSGGDDPAGGDSTSGGDDTSGGSTSGTDNRLTLQVGAYSGNTIKLETKAISSILGVDLTGTLSNIAGFDVGAALTSGSTTIDKLDEMIANVDSYRANLGAVQNRLESSISNQENVIENVSDARSRIRDVDYASETAKMDKEMSGQAVRSELVPYLTGAMIRHSHIRDTSFLCS